MKLHIDIAAILGFTSPLAANVVRFAPLGFLAFLGFLGFIPGWHCLFGFSGFSGFFGFVGLAYIIEFIHRAKNRNA